MIEFILGLLKALLGKVVTDDFVAGCPSFAAWLVTQSARLLNEDRDRHLEQWLADLHDRKTPLRKILFAAGILRAACVLRRDSERASKSSDERMMHMHSSEHQLCSIRAALIRANSSPDTVTHIAAQYGVADFGLFARNYKARFGESPSRTFHDGRLLRAKISGLSENNDQSGGR